MCVDLAWTATPRTYIQVAPLPRTSNATAYGTCAATKIGGVNNVPAMESTKETTPHGWSQEVMTEDQAAARHCLEHTHARTATTAVNVIANTALYAN